MIKKIVVGVDESETAARAAMTAAGIANAFGAQLHVLTAYGKLQVTTIQEGSDEFIFSNETEADSVAASTIAALKAQYPDVNYHHYPGEGKPAEALVRAASDIDADLIVVGNKNVQGLSRVMGSVAAEVAHRANCDVYVVYTHER